MSPSAIGASSRGRPRSSRCSRAMSRRCLNKVASVASTPIAAPAAKNTSSTRISGACHTWSKYRRRLTVSVFLSANRNKARNKMMRRVQARARMAGSTQKKQAASKRCRLFPLAARALIRVHALTQFLAGLEVRNELLRHLDPVARFRIPARTRRAIIQPESAEAANFDALALDQTQGHGIEYGLDRELGVLGNQLRIASRQPADQFGLGHLNCPFYS